MADDALVILHQPEWADPWGHPEYYAGITARRIVAYLIDCLILAVAIMVIWSTLAVLGFLTLGLAWMLMAVPSALAPLAYHTLLIAGPRSATLGMRLMGLRVMSLTPGGDGRPTLFQAIIQTVAFYGSIAATGSLILLAALFNARRRTLHDWLAGTVTVHDGGGTD